MPARIAATFVCASDVPVSGHVLMQAALQKQVDGAISKTINLPEGSKRGDVSSAIRLAWKSGCKGICVYVARSRKLEVLTKGKKEDDDANAEASK